MLVIFRTVLCFGFDSPTAAPFIETSLMTSELELETKAQIGIYFITRKSHRALKCFKIFHEITTETKFTFYSTSAFSCLRLL
jgi:hypothetical protein